MTFVNARAALAFILACLTSLPAMAQAEGGTSVRCVPVSERAGRPLGCFILADQPVELTGSGPIVWQIDSFETRAQAELIKGPSSTVVEAFGRVWLLTIAAPGWRPAAGRHVTEIGPLPVRSGVPHTAMYMEAAFRPGMKSAVHRHSGPEAWYTFAGETCLETPTGMTVGRAGGPPVIVPQGSPMELTATGSTLRQALVLILHETGKAATIPTQEWTPKGLCLK